MWVQGKTIRKIRMYLELNKMGNQHIKVCGMPLIQYLVGFTALNTSLELRKLSNQ